jgi:hypothetical protein
MSRVDSDQNEKDAVILSDETLKGFAAGMSHDTAKVWADKLLTGLTNEDGGPMKFEDGYSREEVLANLTASLQGLAAK